MNWYVTINVQTDGRLHLGSVRHADINCFQLTSHKAELCQVDGPILEHLRPCFNCCQNERRTVQEVNGWEFIRFVRLFMQIHPDGSAVLHMHKRMVEQFQQIYKKGVEDGNII